eukprot:gene7526-biopygen14217
MCILPARCAENKNMGIERECWCCSARCVLNKTGLALWKQKYNKDHRGERQHQVEDGAAIHIREWSIMRVDSINSELLSKQRKKMNEMKGNLQMECEKSGIGMMLGKQTVWDIS